MYELLSTLHKTQAKIICDAQTHFFFVSNGECGQTCALLLFCNRDLEINPMTLKLNGDLDILKIFFTLKMKLLA